jgi:hypothetical protein
LRPSLSRSFKEPISLPVYREGSPSVLTPSWRRANSWVCMWASASVVDSSMLLSATVEYREFELAAWSSSWKRTFTPWKRAPPARLLCRSASAKSAVLRASSETRFRPPSWNIPATPRGSLAFGTNDFTP